MRKNFELPRANSFHDEFVTRMASRMLHAEKFQFCAILVTFIFLHGEEFQNKALRLSLAEEI